MSTFLQFSRAASRLSQLFYNGTLTRKISLNYSTTKTIYRNSCTLVSWHHRIIPAGWKWHHLGKRESNQLSKKADKNQRNQNAYSGHCLGHFSSVGLLAAMFLSTQQHDRPCDENKERPIFNCLFNFMKSHLNFQSVFLRVECATTVNPPKTTLKKDERLTAIRALDVLSDVAEEASPAVVQLTSEHNISFLPSASGSGFIVDDKGHVITNAHVVGHKGTIRVALLDGRSFTGRVMTIDSVSDLALVKLNIDNKTAAKLQCLSLAPQEKEVRPGQVVLALGSPLQMSNSLTMGIVSAVRRDLGHKSGLKYIQTDAIITFGNSGGPLVNLYGEVIGVNTMMADTGFGFAIPVKHVHSFIKQSITAINQKTNDAAVSSNEKKKDRATLSGRAKIIDSFGTPVRRYLGLSMSTLTPELIDLMRTRHNDGNFLSDVKEGVLVLSVNPGSPAKRAQFQQGDVILAVDGVPVDKVTEILRIINNSQDQITFSVQRAGKRLTLNVTPEIL